MIRKIKAYLAQFEDPMGMVICVLLAIATGVLVALGV